MIGLRLKVVVVRAAPGVISMPGIFEMSKSVSPLGTWPVHSGGMAPGAYQEGVQSVAPAGISDIPGGVIKSSADAGAGAAVQIMEPARIIAPVTSAQYSY